MERYAREGGAARLIGMVVCLVCCDREPAAPPVPPEGAPPLAGPALRPAPLQVAAQARPAAPAQRADTCAVEIGGLVKLPDGKMPAPATAFVYVADGDCLAAGARILGRTAVAINSAYFIRVSSPWGADLTVCAAVFSAQRSGAPSMKTKLGPMSRVYGKAPGPLHAAADGQVVFPKVNIELKPGPPHAFPAAN